MVLNRGGSMAGPGRFKGWADAVLRSEEVRI